MSARRILLTHLGPSLPSPIARQVMSMRLLRLNVVSGFAEVHRCSKQHRQAVVQEGSLRTFSTTPQRRLRPQRFLCAARSGQGALSRPVPLRWLAGRLGWPARLAGSALQPRPRQRKAAATRASADGQIGAAPPTQMRGGLVAAETQGCSGRQGRRPHPVIC
jgi:hypothetical protein